MNRNNKILEKAFFFLRHNNDIDHIVPVIYKWLSTKKIPTDIIITSNRSFLKDYRIEYLKQYKNANVYHICDLFKKYSFENFFNIFYPKYDSLIDNSIEKYEIVKKITDIIIKRIAKKIFKGIERGIVVFDWTHSYFVENIVEIAKKRKFVTISLPHGDAAYKNHIITNDVLDYQLINTCSYAKIFDYIVVPSHLCYSHYDKYIDKNRIKLLGSPRYSDEWIDIINKIIPTFNIVKSKNKLKIVLFLRNMGYPIFWEEVVRTIKLILQFPGVFLIVKHHPRNSKAKRLTKKLISIYPKLKKEIDINLKFIYEDRDSFSLIKWADLIIDVGTSVTWDAIKQKKPVLMPEYLHANYSTIAYYIKTSEIKCRDELYDILQKFIKNKNLKFYYENERKKFITEIIDIPDKYILERYSQFLNNCLYESRKKM